MGLVWCLHHYRCTINNKIGKYFDSFSVRKCRMSCQNINNGWPILNNRASNEPNMNPDREYSIIPNVRAKTRDRFGALFIVRPFAWAVTSSYQHSLLINIQMCSVLVLWETFAIKIATKNAKKNIRFFSGILSWLSPCLACELNKPTTE